MYPDVHDKWKSPGVLLGASVYPLNQYYLGLAIEPKHGITIGAGFAVGSEQRLPPSNYVGQYLGPTQILTPSGTLAPVSAPTLNTDTAFRKGGFIMIGFDINIFQAIFSQVANVGTPSVPGSTTTP
jgi:hypothetical protein